MATSETRTYTCKTQECPAIITAKPGEMLQRGWYSHRGGAVGRKAQCPKHVPAWFPEWREKQLAKDEYAVRRLIERARNEQTAEIQGLPTVWQLKFSWPTAWVPENTDFFEVLWAKIFELGGGYEGGGVMTGAPLYNSPSHIHTIWATEEAAFKFVEWCRAWAREHRHEDCDTRFYEFRLKKVTRYTIEAD